MLTEGIDKIYKIWYKIIVNLRVSPMTLTLRSLAALFALALSSMAPAMAHPQTDGWPKVAVGRRGTTSRTMMSISSARDFCRANRGCRLSADIQLGPDNWTSNTTTKKYFPNASPPFDEAGGHRVVEVH